MYGGFIELDDVEDARRILKILEYVCLYLNLVILSTKSFGDVFEVIRFMSLNNVFIHFLKWQHYIVRLILKDLRIMNTDPSVVSVVRIFKSMIDCLFKCACVCLLYDLENGYKESAFHSSRSISSISHFSFDLLGK